MAAADWGYCVVVRVGNRRFGEWTNVGVIIFGADGRQCEARMDALGRAYDRGDWNPEWPVEWVHRCPERLPDLETVERVYRSAGNAIHCVQIGEPLGCRLDADVMERLWKAFITGRE